MAGTADKSPRGTLNGNDLGKSAIMFFLTTLFSGAGAIGVLGMNKTSLIAVGISTASATLAYISKQLATNSNGKIAPEGAK